LIEACDSDKEPRNVKEAQIKPEWKEAMDVKFKALMSNQTWTLVPFKGQEKHHRLKMDLQNQVQGRWFN